MDYRIEIVIGREHEKRGVAFLISTKNGRVTARSTYRKLTKKHRNTLKTRFEYWQGGKRHKKYFHGWDMSEFKGKYTNCFVFKLGNHRFYGFLRSKIKNNNPSYQVCVLVLHAEKNDWETYEPDLRDVEKIRTTSAVHQAVDNFFRGKP